MISKIKLDIGFFFAVIAALPVCRSLCLSQMSFIRNIIMFLVVCISGTTLQTALSSPGTKMSKIYE